MRFLVAACAAAVLLAWPCTAGAGPRAVVAFLPASDEASERLLDEFAERGMAVGLVSPTVGGYSPGQVALDVGQGSRISTRTYPDELAPLRLVREGGGGRVAGWDEAVERARDAPGDAVPGLLADTVRRAGGKVAYFGVPGAPQGEAAAAADRGGRIATVSDDAVPGEADLLVARLPAGDQGLAALDGLLSSGGGQRLVIVLRAPPGGDELELLPAGAAGPGLSGRLRSDTTRRAGLVAATDIAPTVLRHLGLEVPDEMNGQQLEAVRGAEAARETRDLGERLDVIGARRGAAINWILLSWLVLGGVALLARGRAAGCYAMRVVFLSALWLPGTALLTAALRPSRLLELALITGLTLLLGAATDRLLRWPLAPLLPAAVVFLAYTVDLATGSALTALSLAGPSPRGGARFYGVGNELEAMLSVSVIFGAGAALTLAAPRRVPLGFGVACLAAALVLGAGRLGADVGAVITLGAGAAAAIVLSLPGGPTRRAVALAVGLPLAALAALVLVDVVSRGGAHLTRTVLEAGDAGDLADVAERRLELAWRSLKGGLMPVSAGLSVLALAAGLAKRRELVAPLAQVRGGRAFAAGLAGAAAATVVGALANDSGPLILVAGTISLLLAAGYVRGGGQTAGAG